MRDQKELTEHYHCPETTLTKWNSFSSFIINFLCTIVTIRQQKHSHSISNSSIIHNACRKIEESYDWKHLRGNDSFGAKCRTDLVPTFLVSLWPRLCCFNLTDSNKANVLCSNLKTWNLPWSVFYRITIFHLLIRVKFFWFMNIDLAAFYCIWTKILCYWMGR